MLENRPKKIAFSSGYTPSKSRDCLRLDPHTPRFSPRESQDIYIVFCTPDEQDLKQGEGGIKNFGVLPVALHRKHPPSMEPKGHVYKTPYFVHEELVMYRFFLLQSAQSRSHHVT
jgi:hypothetical protein